MHLFVHLWRSDNRQKQLHSPTRILLYRLLSRISVPIVYYTELRMNGCIDEREKNAGTE